MLSADLFNNAVFNAFAETKQNVQVQQLDFGIVTICLADDI